MRRVIASAALVFIAVAAMGVGPVSGNDGPAVARPGTNPYGASYATWAQRWWQWAVGTPSATSPVLHSESCATNLHGKIWYVPQTFFGTSATVHCTVPRGTAFLLMPGGVWNDGAQTPKGGVRAIQNGVDTGFPDIENPRVWVDGQELINLEPFLVRTSPFKLTYATDNILGVPAGTVTAAAMGWQVMVLPLSAGKHWIRVQDASISAGGAIARITAFITVR